MKDHTRGDEAGRLERGNQSPALHTSMILSRPSYYPSTDVSIDRNGKVANLFANLNRRDGKKSLVSGRPRPSLPPRRRCSTNAAPTHLLHVEPPSTSARQR
jgi:hypothetical protein